ncbi:hypothetical protein VT03_31160 [Planctomyces sp. SH-PL14]|nr:hypothetical protein VT03_31160 [Planctomyces sp. SH-PL14]
MAGDDTTGDDTVGMRRVLGSRMGNLVLLGDEVSLLKAATVQGTVSSRGRTLGDDVACDFFCEAGLVQRAGDELRLTDLGWRVARKLIDSGARGVVAIPASELMAEPVASEPASAA